MTDASDSDARAAGKVSGYTLALNYLPIMYVLGGVAATWSVSGTAARWGLALAWIYLVPPVTTRVTLLVFGRPHARAARQHERAYKVWWFLSQLQVVFNRLPALEASLRLVPGLYPAWLNLWGGKVSLLAYWGPGSQILDRYLIEVGRGAVIGSRVIMSGHLGTIAEDGEFVVDIAPVRVGEGVILGAMAALGPGSSVAAAEAVPVGRLLSPFSAWRGGRRVREKA